MKTICVTCGGPQHPGQVHSCSEWRNGPVTVGDALLVGVVVLLLLIALVIVGTYGGAA